MIKRSLNDDVCPALWQVNPVVFVFCFTLLATACSPFGSDDPTAIVVDNPPVLEPFSESWSFDANTASSYSYDCSSKYMKMYKPF